ncbi:MAG: MFS transporter [Ignavibacteriales bacterium]|nr:MFS transporter [Ignavibacteriales bacterium]
MFEWFFGPEVGEKRGVLRQNIAANIIDGGMYAFGISFVSIQTVIPVMVKRISGSDFAVGLVLVLWAAGFNFPQIFIASRAQRFPYKMRLFLQTAVVQRIPWLMLALLSFFILGRLSPTAGTFFFFLLFTLAAVTGSLCFPIWFDLIAKLTPVELRGRLFAARNLLGGILGVFAGLVVERVLAEIAYPLSYGVLFSIAFVFMVGSYWALTKLKEEVPSAVAEEVHILEYYRNLPKILKEQKNFRNFLISDALLIAATMAGAFYAVHAIQKFSLSDSSAGLFTVMIMCSTIVGNMFFGYIADHYGHKVNLILAAASTALSCFMALLAPGQWLYALVFVGMAFQIGLSGISRLSIVAELCSEEERPTYVALTNFVTSPFILFGLVAGGIAGRYGYDAVFLISGLLAVASGLWMAFRVEEPRENVRRPFVQSAQYE